jgi:hypothetical protein
MHLSAQGGVAPLKRDFTSIFMNIKEFIGLAQRVRKIAGATLTVKIFSHSEKARDQAA